MFSLRKQGLTNNLRLDKNQFWDVDLASNVSWGWRKLLQIRDTIRPHFWHVLGDGRNTSAWFDNWDTQCPLMNHVSYRAVTNTGFDLQANVFDVISEGDWA
ncbi:reverse transcriptase zinc-binding domain-containing protein [Artemisia annua]|uniref:Reverse transcriptase zinc-binding domain-containing protein n=1 Tax=Artemisia annua TaxID=35608 RepID=A0A2U1NFM4_ARTAN|nr:reverse transcriptase zinc-binding domain-containing protein [Artemisia annua]